MRIVKIFTIGLVLLLVAAPSSAFIGNKLFGKKLCVVGCGRGPLGIAPLGDALSSANNLLFGPTLDAFESKGKKIVDYAAAKADDSLGKLDITLQKKIDTLAALSQDSIDQLDAVLGNNIKLLSQNLDRFLGGLDIVSIKTVDRLRLVLRIGLLLAAFVILVTWLARSSEDHPRTAKGMWKALRRRAVPASIAGAAIFILVIFFTKPELPKVIAEIESTYQSKMNDLLYPEAATAATYLVQADPSNTGMQSKKIKAEILQDIFYRPTIYKSYDRLFELDNRLEAALIESTPDGKIDLSAVQVPPKIRNDPELETALVMLLWQLHGNDTSRMIAANVAASILQREVDARNPLSPLAAHYLRAYLRNPLRPSEWSELSVLADRKSDGSQSLLEATYGAPKGTEHLRRVLAKHESDKRKVFSDESRKMNEQIAFGSLFASKYISTLSNYFWMTQANACVAKCAEPKKSSALADRKKYAELVIRTWDEIVADEAITDMARSDFNLRLAVNSSLHATYYRAKMYAAADNTGGVIPPMSEVQLASVPPGSLFHELWLAKLQGELAPSSSFVVALLVRHQFLADNERLGLFESKMSNWYANTKDQGLARAAAEAAAPLALIACATTQTEDLQRMTDIHAVECTETSEPFRVMWLIFAQTDPQSRPAIASWADILEKSLSRPVPII